MRLTRFTAVLLALLLGHTGSAFAAQKLGYVRSDELLAKYSATQGAVAQLQEEVEGWRREGAEMEQELNKLYEEFQGRSAMLTEASRQTEEQRIERKKVALDEFVQRYFGPDGKAEKRRAELLKPVESAILEAIRVVAEREGFDMVLDASNSGVVWAESELDLTEKVTLELNTKSGE